MNVIAQGAEAKITLSGKTVIKDRPPKSYRIPVLDTKLRVSRAKSEAKILVKLRHAGVPVPNVLKQTSATLELSYIDGKKLRDALTSKNASRFGREFGLLLRKVHDLNIIHGDLTTSNSIVSDGALYLIDFGLSYHSKRIEDKATDLLVMRRALFAYHTDCAEVFFDALLKAYTDTEVTKRLDVALLRGRNKKKDVLEANVQS